MLCTYWKPGMQGTCPYDNCWPIRKILWIQHNCENFIVVLQWNCSSKMVRNFYYESAVRTVDTVFVRSKYSNVYNSCTLCPILFNPWYVLGQRYSRQAINRHQPPPNQLIALGTNKVQSSFSWFMDMLYLQALAIHSTSFHVNSLLLIKHMSCWKLPVPCGSQ